LTARSTAAKSDARVAGSGNAAATLRARLKYRNVDPTEKSSICPAIPSRKGERTVSRKPASAEPPTGSPSRRGASGASGAARRAHAASRPAHCALASRRSAERRMRPATPTRPASQATAADPRSAPALPPAETKPKSRLACPLVKRSAMKLQKTETTNRL
jgi:hypothetical protein